MESEKKYTFDGKILLEKNPLPPNLKNKLVDYLFMSYPHFYPQECW